PAGRRASARLPPAAPDAGPRHRLALGRRLRHLGHQPRRRRRPRPLPRRLHLDPLTRWRRAAPSAAGRSAAAPASLACDEPTVEEPDAAPPCGLRCGCCAGYAGRVKPPSHLSPADARALLGVCFDLDDTLLDDGRLSLGALDALYRLDAAGLILIGATGRPAAWGQVLTRQWPVSGIVTENGIIALLRRHGRIEVLDRVDRQ